MRKVKIQHTINCDVDTFWEVFFDGEFTDQLYNEALAFKSFELLEQSDSSRRLRGVPNMSMPKPVMKVLGDSFGYEERGEFDREKSEYNWKIIANVLTNKLRNEGTLRVEAAGDGKCRACDEMQIEAKIFGLGGLIESSTEKEFRDAWAKISRFMNEWVAR